jgi:hypothetical protein
MMVNGSFTSIGDFETTVRNAALRRTGADGEAEYLPAYMLKDFLLERANRKAAGEGGEAALSRPRAMSGEFVFYFQGRNP